MNRREGDEHATRGLMEAKGPRYWPSTSRRRGPNVVQRDHPSLGLALGLAGALLVIDGLAWRAVAAMFDRERLLTGGRR